ncbi:MFS transporter [Pseudonocardia sp. GCM10023141]|uniref:MFS transporter n=1 Tax=Pseudonocardia sp. GCM10023141 TaxID=3252653 RepID=UPI0036228E5C
MPAYPVYLLIRGVAAFAMATAGTLNLVYQIQTIGLGPLELVLVGTVLEITCFVAQIPTGVIADLYSRRLSVIIGYLLIGIGFALEGLVPAFVAVLIGNVIWGIGATCVDGAEEAWITDEAGEERAGRTFTRGSQVAQIATVLGIGASVALASVRLNLPVVIGAAGWIVLGLALIVIMPERHFHRAPADERGSFRSMRTQVATGGGVVRSSPVLLCLLGAVFFVGLSSETRDRLTHAHFLADLTFPTIGTPVLWFGAMSVAAMLCSIVLTEVVRRRSQSLRADRVGRLLVAFGIISTLAAGAFALAGEFWTAVAASLIGALVRGSAEPLQSTWIAERSDSRSRATVFSLVGQVDAAGQIVGGPPIGLLGERAGIRAALLAAALLVAPAVGLYARAQRLQSRSRS